MKLLLPLGVQTMENCANLCSLASAVRPVRGGCTNSCVNFVSRANQAARIRDGRGVNGVDGWMSDGMVG